MKNHMLMLLAFLTTGSMTPLTAQEDLSVLSYWNYHKGQPFGLYRKLADRSFEQLRQRGLMTGALGSRQEWTERQRQISGMLKEMVGSFPGKTPLNPVVTGVLIKDGVKVEKLYFESLPGYYVTAALFMPEKPKGRLPAIVYCSGHSPNGFRSEVYQRVILNYVKKGFAVLAFDPIGQGERVQYFREDGTRRFGPTHEHSYPGSQVFVSGISPALFFIWDGIRAIDYLAGRKEVDASRIGITGRSGGGTQSAYIGAMDDRVIASAPECYITTFEKLLRSKGPQDAEQNLVHAFRKGFDITDLIVVRAPKPTLILATTNDIFSIEGAREVFREAGRAYTALGSQAMLQMAEDEAGHASTLRNREAAYAFFRQHLQNPGTAGEEEVKAFSEEELYVTPQGRLYDFLKGKTLYSALKEYEGRQKGGTLLSGELRNRVAEIAGYQQPGEPAEGFFSGSVTRESYVIEKYLVKGPGDYFIPLLWLKPSAPVKGTVLFLDEAGKQHAVRKGGYADQLALQGYEVVVPDLSGAGELNNTELPGGDARIEEVSLNLWYLSILTDKSLVACRVEEIGAVAGFIERSGKGSSPLHLIAAGALGSEALHASVLMPEAFSRKVLVRPLVSFRALVQDTHYKVRFMPSVVAGAIRYYDLPRLAAANLPGTVGVIDPVGGNGEVLTLDEAVKWYGNPESVREIYVSGGAGEVTGKILSWLGL